ncbi:MAG: hemolysin XhlA family protein [Waterburya sp.]
MTVSIEQDLKDILNKMEAKIDNLSKDVVDLKVSAAKLTEKTEAIEKDVKELKGTQKAQIWSLIVAVFTAILGLSSLLIRSSLT